MIDFLKNSFIWASSILSAIFTFVPESFFGKFKFSSSFSNEKNIIIARLLSFVIILLFTMVIYKIYLCFRKNVKIKGHNCCIEVRYGNIFDIKNCKKVIAFDECFTTKVGELPSEIKPSSVCGQYLDKCPIQDIQPLIDRVQLKPLKSNSKFQNKTRYESGKLIPRDDYLLMAFAKLDKDGLGGFASREEYLNSLSILWKEINKYYGQQNVCIPILGSGLTRIGDSPLEKQELLNMIIKSYSLTTHKIKKPYKLIIVYIEDDEDFSINKIDASL